MSHIERWEPNELVMQLRMRQLKLARSIEEKDKNGITIWMRELLRLKLNTDQLLSDLSAELGLGPAYHRLVDTELSARGLL